MGTLTGLGLLSHGLQATKELIRRGVASSLELLLQNQG